MLDGARRVRCDQCQFGMTSVDGAGNVGLDRKATGFMKNDEYIAEAVNRQCFGGHDHIQLLNGCAKVCEKFVPRLVAAVLRALRQSVRGTRADGMRSTADNRSSGGWADSGGAGVALTTLTVLKSSETGALDCR